MNRSGPSASIVNPEMVKMYAPREKIYAREVAGRYTNWRWICVWITQLVYYGLPWLKWNGREAVLFDLAARKFYIFGLVLWPQDFIYLAGLLIVCACLLFLLSAVAGRVWCSFACPHSVYTEMFMWIERKIEGNRTARMRLDRQPHSLARFAKKAFKHVAWMALALWTGITLVGYFTPMPTLLHEAATMMLGPWESFWIMFYALLAYVNAGWMREQICQYLCAYARFQSVMFDKDTLVITYDRERGEPRGIRRKNCGSRMAAQGSCVDCTICVQVCPAGIDIRNGLQYECMDCGACIDACDKVMDKIGEACGLIRYSSENAVVNHLSAAQIRQRILRPRVLTYIGILGAIVAFYAAALTMRAPLKLDVILDRSTIGREAEDGMVENVYRLQIMNTDERTHRYKIEVCCNETIAVAPDEVSLEGTASRALPVRVRVARDKVEPGPNKISFGLKAQDDARLQTTEKAVFLVPSR